MSSSILWLPVLHSINPLPLMIMMMMINIDDDIVRACVVETATKQCLENGTWYERDQLPWTDYTRCLDKTVSFNQLQSNSF